MRMFWWDGLFANATESVVLQYLPLFALAFGASNGQIGLQAALVSLMATVALFPGARLAETWGRRKAIVLLFGGTLARLMLLALAGLPFIFEGSQAVSVIIAFAALRAFFGNLAMPAWTSLAADIVPMDVRGRFFSSRNVGMGLAALAATPAAGFIISRAGFPEGYELVWLLAFAAGMVSTFFYARIPEPVWQRPEKSAETRAPSLLADSNFVAYCATALAWNLSLYVVAPFFNVYLVRELDASALWVGVLAAVSSVFGLAGQFAFGPLNDRRGPRWLMAATGLGIPFLPWAWYFVGAPWHVIFINAFGGFLWAGYMLGNFNLLLHLSPDQWRPRYTAAYQSLVFFSAFVGPLVGGAIADGFGIKPLFIISGAGWMLSVLLFVRLVREQPAVALRPATTEGMAGP